jgi:hypothetical protein
MVRTLCLAGFAGVYVDRRGYGGRGEEVITALRALLGREVVSSGSGEQLLFNLDAATAASRATMSERDWEQAKERLLTRPCVLCQDGFYPWAPTDSPEPRRAMHWAAMRLVNPGTESRRVTLSMNWKQHAKVDVHIQGPSLGVDANAAPPVEFEPFALAIVLPPGEHLVHFDARPRPVGLARMYCAWIATDVRLEVRD